MNDSWENFWWSHITGANMLVQQVSNALFEHKFVILNVPSDLPWRCDMRSTIELNFQSVAENEGIYVQTVDVNDECPDKEPGKFLLETMEQVRDIRNGFRAHPGYTIQHYLIQNQTLSNHIIWIKGMNTEQAIRWVNFCKAYFNISSHAGLFVLEVHDKYSDYDSKKAVVVNYDDYITSYDVQIFNSFILSTESQYSSQWKQYISVVAACLCDTDAEVSYTLLQNCNFKCDDPLQALSEIADSDALASRGCDDKSQNILAYCRKNNIAEMQRRLWSAQIKVLFPIVETGRIRIIDTLYENLCAFLDSRTVFQYNEPLHDPKDMELGTLDYLVNSGRFYVKDSQLRERISFLHMCRNGLAHMNCCPPETVVKLLDDTEI